MNKIENVGIIQEVDGQDVPHAYFTINDNKVPIPIRSKQEVGLIIGTLKERSVFSKETAEKLCDTSRTFCLPAKQVRKIFYDPLVQIQMTIDHFVTKSKILACQ
jgi:hypothetical protein